MPDASVVVPVHNGSRFLLRCLNALASQEDVDLEIIVVDDGSTDDSSAVAKSMGVKVVRQAKAGPAAARNLGFRRAASHIILFTDADCAPQPFWAVTLLRAFDDPNVAGCKGAYDTRQSKAVARFVQADYEDRYRRMLRRGSDIDFVDTYSAAYRLSVLQHLDGFDETFCSSSVEDQDLSFRAVRAGYRLRFVPEATVEHIHPTTLRTYVLKKFKIGYYKAHLHAQSRDGLTSDCHTPPVLRVQTLIALVFLVNVLSLPWSRRARTDSLWLYIVLLVTSLPFAVRTAAADTTIALLTPTLVVIRASALAAGLTCGAVSLLARRFQAGAGGVCTPRRSSSLRKG